MRFSALRVLVGLLVVALASCDNNFSANSESQPTEKSGGPFTKKQVEHEGVFYYRLQASYRVKGTGEPIDFDFVVACGATVTHWRYTGPSTRVSTEPLVMIKPTADGGAVLVRTYRRLCEAQKLHWGRNNEYGAPDDLMPFVIWFDDVSDLSFGWGYATEDAYYNTNSKLDFLGASVSEATHEDWRAWRKKAADDYKQIGQLPGPWGYSFTNSPRKWTDRIRALNGGKDITNSCTGYVRIPAPKEIIEKIWASAPDYNPAPPDGVRYFPIVGAQKWINDIIADAGPVFNGHNFHDYRGNPSIMHLGAINSNNSGFIRDGVSEASVIGEHYPLLPRSKSSDTPITAPADVYPRRILIGDEWKGMIACGGNHHIPGPDKLYEAKVDPGKPQGEQVYFIPGESFDIDWREKTYPLYINDEIIVPNLLRQTVSGLSEHILIVDREGFILYRAPWGLGGP